MSEPIWTKMFREFTLLENRARSLKHMALEIRCDALESGGARCTKDTHAGTDHAYVPEHISDGAHTWADRT